MKYATKSKCHEIYIHATMKGNGHITYAISKFRYTIKLIITEGMFYINMHQFYIKSFTFNAFVTFRNLNVELFAGINEFYCYIYLVLSKVYMSVKQS